MSSSTPIESLPNFNNNPEDEILEDYDQMPMQMHMPIHQQQRQLSVNAIKTMSFIEKHKEDLKFAGIVFFAVIIVHFTSLEKYFMQFIKLDNIPHNEIILRAIAIALIAIITKKLI